MVVADAILICQCYAHGHNASFRMLYQYSIVQGDIGSRSGVIGPFWALSFPHGDTLTGPRHYVERANLYDALNEMVVMIEAERVSIPGAD